MNQKKYFGTDGIRGRVGGDVINPEFVAQLGAAFGRHLGGEGVVLIGHDTRESAEMLENALIQGLSSSGVKAKLLGPMPSPAVAYLTRQMGADAGVVISASHNQFHDNGIKFFSKDGYKLSDEEELAVEAAINKDEKIFVSDQLNLRDETVVSYATDDYIKFCKASLPWTPDFSHLKVVLDCANGATSDMAPHIFRDLKLNVVEFATSPSGKNINKDCGATSPEILQKKVLEENADVGFAFDGDGDRIIAVDEKGNVLDGDDILYVLSEKVFQDSAVKRGVVGTLMTNMALEQALLEKNIAFERVKVGDRHVMARLKALGWVLGGEASGHILNLEHTTTGDGIVIALQLLNVMQETAKTLSALRSGFQKYPQVLVNVPVDTRFNIKNENINKAIGAAEAKLKDKGRVLLRASGTEPVVRVMVEGEDEALVKTLVDELAMVVKSSSFRGLTAGSTLTDRD